MFHPTKERTLIGLFRIPSPKCHAKKRRNCPQVLVLKISHDFGDSWNYLFEGFSEISWGYSPDLHGEDSLIPKNRLIFTKKVFPGKRRSHTSAFYTDDYFKTTHILLVGGFNFAQTKDYIYVAKFKKRSRNELDLYFSKNTEISFKKVIFPSDLLRHHAYTVVEGKSSRVFLHVSHHKGFIPYGHLYVSDSTGGKFELSIKNNVRNSLGFCDFTKVKGIEGVYIVNVFDSETLSAVKIALASADSEQEKIDIASTGLSKMTRITFNQGRTWHQLNVTNPQSFTRVPFSNFYASDAVEESSEGSLISPCSSPPCALHLHSFSTSFSSPIHSSASAPGVIMGNGNIGDQLSTVMNTFYSADGGVSWQALSQGASTFDIGQQGGLLMLAKEQDGSKISLSLDFGQDWIKIDLLSSLNLSSSLPNAPKPRLKITSITTNPHFGLKFTLFGSSLISSHSHSSNSSRHPHKSLLSDSLYSLGFISTVDFSALFPEPCDEASNSLGEWMPSFPGDR